MDIVTFAQPFRSGMYIAALLMCLLFVSVIRKTSLPNKGYLTLFLGLKVLIALCEWLMIYVSAPTHYFWLALLIVLSFGLAPLLLKFAQGVSSQSVEDRFQSQHLWSWGLLLTSVLLMMPLFLASQVLMSFDFGAGFGRFIHITMSLCIVLFVAQVSFYWYKVWGIYRFELRRTKEQFASLQQAPLMILKWLLILAMGNLVFSLLRTFNVWFWQSQPEVALVANILEYLLLVCCLFFMFHNALPIAHGRQGQITANQLKNTTALSSTSEQPSKLKRPQYAKTQLDEKFRNRIKSKLLDTAKVTQLASDSMLSLSKFASAIGEKPYYVTQVLNQDLHSNFYEFITDHRLQEVARQLAVPSTLTILDIALAAGFNAKSTFNTAFKKRFGVTPSEYRSNPTMPAHPESVQPGSTR